MTAFNICLSKSMCQDIPDVSTRRNHEMGIAANSFSIKDSEIQDFVNTIKAKGYSFCPATFQNKCRRKGTFEQTHLSALFFQ